MNANLTFDSVVYNKQFDENGFSKRQNTSRGINTPDVLSIKNESYTDSVTKVTGTRFLVRFDRHDIDAAGEKRISSIYAVIAVPSTAESTDIDDIVAKFRAAVADADLIDGVLNGEV